MTPVELRYGPYWVDEYAWRAEVIYARLRREAERHFGRRWQRHVSLPERLSVTTPDREHGPQSLRGYVVVRISTAFDEKLNLLSGISG